jgi:hypothetical protein
MSPPQLENTATARTALAPAKAKRKFAHSAIRDPHSAFLPYARPDPSNRPRNNQYQGDRG